MLSAKSFPSTDDIDDISVGTTFNEAGRAYDAVDDRYVVYADGAAEATNSSRDMARDEFTGRYSFADRELWHEIDAILSALYLQGRRSVHILDVGCGSGTWLCRVVERAAELGFNYIHARGFDVSTALAGRAAAMAAELTRSLPRDMLHMAIELADARRPLPDADGSVDLCLCLYGVFNHLPQKTHAIVAAEFARVTRGHIVLTVRAVGSQPTIYVDGIERAGAFRQDNQADQLDVDLEDGRHLTMRSHLFRAEELQLLFMPHVSGSTVRGLDLFHGRFRADPRWNPDAIDTQAFLGDLDRLEQFYANIPDFIDHAAHILLTASCARH